jgi:hypothetical protein
MKIYTTHDGRTKYAVAAKSRKDACAIFNSNGLTTTVHYMANYGYIWERGQVKNTDVIFDNPGVVFQSGLTLCEFTRRTATRQEHG